MSALCQKQTLAPLFDHLVGECQQFVGNFKAKRLGCGKIEDEMESGGLFDGNVGWLGTTQNLVHEFGGAARLYRSNPKGCEARRPAAPEGVKFCASSIT